MGRCVWKIVYHNYEKCINYTKNIKNFTQICEKMIHYIYMTIWCIVKQYVIEESNQ